MAAKKGSPQKGGQSQKGPHDFTGQQLERAREEQAQAEKDRSNELTMATQAAEAEVENTITDVTGEGPPVIEEAPQDPFEETTYDAGDSDGEEVIEEADTAGKPSAVIRVNTDLKTNIGYRNPYEFEAGRRYRVPLHVAQHLDEKGYVWH